MYFVEVFLLEEAIKYIYIFFYLHNSLFKKEDYAVLNENNLWVNVNTGKKIMRGY